MRKLFYMGLESYEARYTLQLTDWNRRVFERRGLDVVYVPGTTIDDSKSISVGQVLDAHGRSYFGMSQIMNLVQMMRNGECTGEDVIYFEDMFQPGMESLPYIMDQFQMPKDPVYMYAVLPKQLIQMILYMYGACPNGWAYMRKWYVSLLLSWLLTKKW